MLIPIWYRKVQRLRLQLRELQSQLKAAPVQDKYLTPPDSVPVSVQEGPATPQLPLNSAAAGKEWEGVQIYDARTNGSIYYGPLSSSFFGTRMGHYLADVLSKSDPETSFISSIARLNYPPTPLEWQDSPRLSLTGSLDADVEDLSRAQEEYFLDLLWQSFHCVYPIIAEAEFREYYDSLWLAADEGLPRRPSPLVDSLLAVCMQYGSTFLISDEDNMESERGHHVAMAAKTSHAYFSRAQALLLHGFESPSLMTLQSHTFCIIYLLGISLFNAAHTLLGNAVRLARTLRVHLRNPNLASQEQEELHRRNWYTLFQLDSQLSMALGRPPLIQPGDECDLPGDSEDHALLSGSMLLSPNHEDISWLSFHVQSTRLTAAVQKVHSAFSARAAQILERKNAQRIYDDPFMVEELAGFLGREVRAVYNWARNVPQSLKIERKGSGEAFSTERNPLNLDVVSPLWLQRQRLLLELLYHYLQLTNFRTFLRFPPGSSSITPLSDCHGINSLNHAMALTNILHQVLTDTDLLRGWTPVFQYQWDAALCIMGFVLANPVCPPSPAARRCMHTAIKSFETMGKYFPAAAEAAQTIREIGAQAEILVERFHDSLSMRKSGQRDGSAQAAARAATSAAVQIFAAPALTPEYLDSLVENSDFDFSGFMGRDLLAGGDASVPLAGPSTGSTPLPSGSGDVLAGMGSSWMDDGAGLDSLTGFPG